MRRKTNRKKGILIALAALIVLAAACIFLMNMLFVVRNVVISGDVHVSGDEIIRAAKVDMGGSIWKVDEEVLRRNLQSGGKYALDDAHVEMPGTVILTIRERTRDAMVLNGGRILVLDSDGYVVEVCPTMPENSGMFVTGLGDTSYRVGEKITAPEERLRSMKQVLDAIRTEGVAGYLSELNVADENNLWLISRTGIRVLLGNEENMANKLMWARIAITDLESRGVDGGTLDVSSGTKADFKP